MAGTLDRLVKAFEALRVFNTSETDDDPEKKPASLAHKERAQHLETVCDCIGSQGLRTQNDFPKFLGIALETFLNLCDDAESDVRMTAEECLNRTIKALLETNLGRIQVELYKEIKKNGSPRTLRAALWRFAELCHLIRPQKCRPYVVNLLPCIVRISRRTEESVQETLASSMNKICGILMRFAVDTEVESLLKTLLPNLSSESAATRRTAANCLVLVCSNSRRPVHFSYRLLEALLGLVVPVQSDTPVPLLVGVFQTFRHLAPVFSASQHDDDVITGSFGQLRQEEPTHVDSKDHFSQVFEVLLHYVSHADHNVTTAALESMQQLLKSPPPKLIEKLSTERGIPKAAIFGLKDESKPAESESMDNLRLPSLSGDDSMLEDESDKQVLLDPASEEMEPSVEDDTVFSSEDSDSADCSETAVNVQSLSTYSFAEFNQDEPENEKEPEEEVYEEMDISRDESELTETRVCEGYIGCLHESRPLLYLARLLGSKFLLGGKAGSVLSDRTSRVSVKALSLSCVSLAVSYSPSLLTEPVFVDGDKQKLSDVMLLHSHHDPQIRGQVLQVVCNFVSAVLALSQGWYSHWLNEQQHGDLAMDKLFAIISQITADSSAVTVRLAMNGLKTCLNAFLKSQDGLLGLQLLNTALQHRASPYWLVKIELLELLKDLDYRVLAYLENKSGRKVSVSTQDLVLEDVFVYLLGDDDLRVRQAAAESLPSMVARIFYPTSSTTQDSVVALAQRSTEALFEPMMTEWSRLPPPLVHGLQDPYHFDPLNGSLHLTANLSRVLTIIYNKLLTFDTRAHVRAGCFLALERLIERYPAAQYRSAWRFRGQAQTRMMTDNPLSPCGGGLLSTVLSYLTNSHLSLTLNVHEDLLNLAGHLIAGISSGGLSHLEDVSKSNNTDRWIAVTDRKMAALLDKMLSHLIKLLNLFTSIIDDQGQPQQLKQPVLAQLTTPSLSPIKLKKSKDEGENSEKKPKKDKESEDKKQKKEGGWMFYSSLHYTRLHDILKGAYSNYQTSIGLASQDKFCRLVTTALNVLSNLLELAVLADVAQHADEVLGLLKTLITIDPTSSVFCVQQLLKALFGMNLVSLWSEDSDVILTSKSVSSKVGSDRQRGMYYHCFTKPYTQLTQNLAASQSRLLESGQPPATFLGWVKRSSERRVPAILKPGSQADKSSIAAYIRLFEPLVIRALKLYTITCSLSLQCRVLDLLTQLIMLRVNYCLLDSDQVFIGFIMKQFEFIEQGYIRNSEQLIPNVFKFLVLLSYERYHSKVIVGMPKVIQLCDGIMANDLQPVTHAVPAIRFIVLDLFAVRQIEASNDLETQREVVVSMLLRLVQYHQVIELLIIVLSHLHQDNEEKWKRLSRQVVDLLLPLLEKQQVDVSEQSAMDVIHRLFEVVPTSVFRPVDTLVKLLLDTKPNMDAHHRYLAFINIILRVLIIKSKENVILSRIFETRLESRVQGDFPLEKFNGTLSSMESSMVSTDSEGPDSVDFASSPECCLAKCLLGVVAEAGAKLCELVQSLCRVDTDFTARLLGHLLMYMTHMFQSGGFSRTAGATKRLLLDTEDGFLSEINACFLELRSQFPMLTLKWCHLLTLLNYDGTDWWAEVLLQTVSKEHFVTPNQEVVRRGALMLLCDNVCENIFGAETMISVIVNHVNDLLHLSHEPPVQDFISAIHRNPSASGLFIQAIQSRCRPMLSSCKTLRCLEAAHLSQSIALLALLIDRFLPSHRLSSVRLADTMACRRLEMLLSEPKEELRQQITPDSLSSILNKLEDGQLAKRHPRLHSLVHKLHSQNSGEERKIVGKAHPITLVTVNKDYMLNKDAFLAIAQDRACARAANGRESAMLLQWLEYQDAYSIMSSKNFNLTVLLECIALGVHKTLIMVNKSRDSISGQSDQQSHDPLLMAAQRTLFKRIRTVVSVVPSTHQHVFKRGQIVLGDKTYLDQLLVLLTDDTLVKNCHLLAESLVKYLVSLNLLPKKPKIPSNTLQEIVRFCAFICEICGHSLAAEVRLSSSSTVTLLELVSSVVQHEDLVLVLSEPKYNSLVFTYIAALHSLMKSLVIYPRLPDWLSDTAISEFVSTSDVMAAWSHVGDLLYLMKTLNNDHGCYRTIIPAYVRNSVENAIVGLCRLPILNTFAVVPRIVWKLHWRPELCSESTVMPPLPLDYLQDTSVLRDFILASQTLGWSSRQQFEETWMSLLGVINPVQLEEHEPSPEEIIERSQCTVLAIKGITRLLVQTMRYPNPGNTCNSIYTQPIKDRFLPFLNARNGRKLAIIRGLLEKEIQPACRVRSRVNTHHHYTTMGADSHKFKYLYDGNVERPLGWEEYDVHQVSVEGIWANIGQYEDGEDEAFAPRSVPPRANPLGLDIHSCLQFLIELYQQWFTPGAKIPLMQLNEAIKSLVILSDLFTERSQFDWMLDSLLEVQKFHPFEDELMNQYCVVGLCKAAAVVGMDIVILEKVSRTLDQAFKSTHLASRMGAMYGSLYLLEAGMTEGLRALLPTILAYLLRYLSGNLTVSAVVSCEHHSLLVWTTAFYIIEHYPDDIDEVDFHNRVFQSAVQILGGPESVSLNIYMAVSRGMERLVVAEAFTQTEMDVLVKNAKDKMACQNPQRLLPALGLLLTCVYSGKRTTENPINPEDPAEHDPDLLLADMERIALLFDRTRKGYPLEANVISRILPTFLTDFFPPQDIMNKVICEFLSNQQAHPQLMSKIVFQVFNSLQQQRQFTLVREWVMLSLSNFTQRTPLSMAIWSLTCFLVSASSNQWLRALLHHIIERMGKVEAPDVKLFCMAAVDFYSQIPDEASREVFRSTFQKLAAEGSPYLQLINCLDK